MPSDIEIWRHLELKRLPYGMKILDDYGISREFGITVCGGAGNFPKGSAVPSKGQVSLCKVDGAEFMGVQRFSYNELLAESTVHRLKTVQPGMGLQIQAASILEGDEEVIIASKITEIYDPRGDDTKLLMVGNKSLTTIALYNPDEKLEWTRPFIFHKTEETPRT
jgi:hypothetical protein